MSSSVERAPGDARGTQKIHRLSVIAPMLNEAAHIEGFVDDLASQDYSGPVEVFIADGGSTDGSVELLRAAAERASTARQSSTPRASSSRVSALPSRTRSITR